MSNKIYDLITNQMVEKLEKGVVPWQKPWSVHNPWPVNFASKRNYRGINVFILYMENLANNYESPFWLTFNQAKKISGYKKSGRFWKWDGKGKDPKYGVKKGEKSTMVVFWKFLEVADDDKPGKMKRIPLLRYYNVFNVDQCHLPDKILKKIKSVEKRDESDVGVIEKAEKICNEYEIEVKHGGEKAYYHKNNDFINLPNKTRFASDADYYLVRFHEMVHSTGHKDRLNRDTIVDATIFGNNNYSKEELIAEMGACFLAAEAGINLKDSKLFDNSAAYLRGWLSKIKNDTKLLIQAAGKAQKAVDYILGRKWDTEESN